MVGVGDGVYKRLITKTGKGSHPGCCQVGNQPRKHAWAWKLNQSVHTVGFCLSVWGKVGTHIE